MKNYIIIFLCAIVSYSYAQIPFTNFSINGKTFEVDSTYSVTLILTEINNPIRNGTVVSNGIGSEECSQAITGYGYGGFYTFDYRKPDFIKFMNIFRSVFPQSRVFEITENYSVDDTMIDLEILIDPRGNILQITYTIGKDLARALKPSELELLDRKLRTEMVFTLKPGHICEGRNIIPLYNGGYGFTLATIYMPFAYGRGNYWENSDSILQLMLEDGEDPRR